MLFSAGKSAEQNCVGVAGWLEQNDRGWIPGVGQECRWGSSSPWSHLEKTATFQRSVTGPHRHPAQWRMVKRPPFSGTQ